MQSRLGDRCADESGHCLLYTSDAADERSSVDLGGRRIIKKKKTDRLRTGVVNRHINMTHDNTTDIDTSKREPEKM